MNKILFFIGIALVFFANAQTTNDFESFTLNSESYNNGSDFSGGFAESSVYLPNFYDTVGGYVSWGGFAISNVTDVTTQSFNNQYAVSSGSGYNNSSNFALFYESYGTPNVLKLHNTTDIAFESMYINNSTYAYLSMKNGDQFAKKFGGASGNDPDYFYISIKKFHNGILGNDSINFYLADFRFPNNNQDYIINEWTKVDLLSLGVADSLQFKFYSSDVGQFGINTPTYFCMDNVTTTNATGINNISEINAKIYPNPTSTSIKISTSNTQGKLLVSNMLGKIIVSTYHSNFSEINTSTLPSGIYNITLVNSQNNKTYHSNFIKQ